MTENKSRWGYHTVSHEDFLKLKEMKKSIFEDYFKLCRWRSSADDRNGKELRESFWLVETKRKKFGYDDGAWVRTYPNEMLHYDGVAEGTYAFPFERGVGKSKMEDGTLAYSYLTVTPLAREILFTYYEGRQPHDEPVEPEGFSSRSINEIYTEWRKHGRIVGD